MKWREQLNGDCQKRDAHSMHERCDLVCPDLPKVLQQGARRRWNLRQTLKLNLSESS